MVTITSLLPKKSAAVRVPVVVALSVVATERGRWEKLQLQRARDLARKVRPEAKGERGAAITKAARAHLP